MIELRLSVALLALALAAAALSPAQAQPQKTTPTTSAHHFNGFVSRFSSGARVRDGDSAIKGSKIGINDLPAPPPPRGSGYNEVSVDDTAGKEKAPTAPLPKAGLAPKPGGTTRHFDYPGAYAQRFDGVDASKPGARRAPTRVK